MSLSSGLNKTIGDDEQIARFLRQSSYVVKSTGRIKHPAFLPAPDNDTSTFRVSDLDTEDIQVLAELHVKERSKNGAAVLKAKHINKAHLKIEAKEPPDRHANIRGWSTKNDPELCKAERKAAAMHLAAESELLKWA